MINASGEKVQGFSANTYDRVLCETLLSLKVLGLRCLKISPPTLKFLHVSNGI